MRPISLFIASSLDGFITGSNDSLEWLFTDQDYGYTAFFDAIGAVIMGRKTFDVACTFEKIPYPGKVKYVFTRRAPEQRSRRPVYFGRSSGVLSSATGEERTEDMACGRKRHRQCVAQC
jgi:dihydrofolate reductase